MVKAEHTWGKKEQWDWDKELVKPASEHMHRCQCAPNLASANYQTHLLQHTKTNTEQQHTACAEKQHLVFR